MTLTFNRAAYANLLADVLPQPIRSQAEYDRVLGIIEASMNKEAVSSEEEQLIDLFVILVEKFESEHYPSQNRSTPHSRLLHLMDANDVQPADLVSIFGSSDRVLEVIDGKQSIDLNQAEKLGNRFNLPSKLFLA
ncbi:helix-turn-helix domain-containing protein [Chamaesiphon minutus]|uniref:Putative transcription regulator containing HTH domain n=1 Tax=Chamaesiphon minutus (strain ATCC 27169 / PCC 6605) TaxID=1173020 RepID=K9UID5_CHAP6|nr:transcription regulator containing HTH domain [Chamaesiphon minutus]AFY94408.1 putative transcription regulator containing HTH domain [Chamaesiphon minutus PCC 6605]